VQNPYAMITVTKLNKPCVLFNLSVKIQELRICYISWIMGITKV